MRNKWFVAAPTTTPVERALAEGLVSETDLLRLKAIARLHAWGLPADMTWSDLLQEAILRVLQGSRRRPAAVPIVAFLAGVMRSIKAEQWRRLRREPRANPTAVASAQAAEEPSDPAPDPEQRLAAQQELAAIYLLFAADSAAIQILSGLAAGLTPDEIREASQMTKTDYDSTRKRMRRALLRAGLAWRPK